MKNIIVMIIGIVRTLLDVMIFVSGAFAGFALSDATDERERTKNRNTEDYISYARRSHN